MLGQGAFKGSELWMGVWWPYRDSGEQLPFLTPNAERLHIIQAGTRKSSPASVLQKKGPHFLLFPQHHYEYQASFVYILGAWDHIWPCDLHLKCGFYILLLIFFERQFPFLIYAAFLPSFQRLFTQISRNTVRTPILSPSAMRHLEYLI